MSNDLGFMFRREWAPELLVDVAQAVEAAGLAEMWVVEDLEFHGGFAQIATALASTRRITVGLGIAPAVARNVAYSAMEIATVARLFPGRFHMGYGHGVETWIAQVGATPISWLASLGEVTIATKALLAGETVTTHGRHVDLESVTLVHPAVSPPLISLGVRQPKGMALAGDVADGVIFAEGSGPRYVAQVRATVGPSSRLTVFVQASSDVAAISEQIASKVAQPRFAVQLAAYGNETPPLDELMISGPPDTWAGQARKWFDAGADCVVYCLLPSDSPGMPLSLSATEDGST